jgi:hypothetical protein
MLKNITRLFLLALAIFISTGCSKTTNSNISVATNTNGTNGNSVANPIASAGAPSPNNSAKTTQVRLTMVETNADLIDAPLADSTIIIKAGEASFNKKTDKDGVALFDSVPCGNEVVITARDEDNEEDTVLNRRLECNESQTDLGVLTKPFGGKFILEQRKPQHMEYDPSKNVWLSEGKVVPMEKVRGILSKYTSK